MKKLMIIMLTASLALLFITASAGATEAKPEEARDVAANWLALIVHHKGDWGFCDDPDLGAMQELKRGDRHLGYFFQVEPMGFIVVSLHKELAPVKACSETCNLDPASDEGLADLIKGGMERVLDAVETLNKAELDRLLEINYSPSWKWLAMDPKGFDKAMLPGSKTMDYAEGEILLSSSWHQQPPYNDDCPNMGCAWPQYNNYNQGPVVGCVATAGAQIMRYWNWPPYGVGSPYSDTNDWSNMLDRYVWQSTPTPGFYDDMGTPCTQAQIDAVAELNAEVGQAVGMSYGCNGSSAATYDMEDVFEDQYRYSINCRKRDRKDETATQWFDRLKTQFNKNRPVQYKIVGHSIVGDGWRVTGNPPVKQYHMNYGWDSSHDTWYTLDALYLGDTDKEYIVENIYPEGAMGTSISGAYSKPAFPYRYMDRDATCGDSASFAAGHRIQFMPEMTVTSTSTTGGSITFSGSATSSTRLFSRGIVSRGARIWDGAIKLRNDGSIKFPDD